jgi:hypothetical protein
LTRMVDKGVSGRIAASLDPALWTTNSRSSESRKSKVEVCSKWSKVMITITTPLGIVYVREWPSGRVRRLHVIRFFVRSELDIDIETSKVRVESYEVSNEWKIGWDETRCRAIR